MHIRAHIALACAMVQRKCREQIAVLLEAASLKISDNGLFLLAGNVTVLVVPVLSHALGKGL
jgi:hypothetical protein